ncbi:MAG: nucleotidyltransferase domain protein [Candidatus Magnetoglobus multicellularis str. Araruama]|uniref:Nucleotidyltransferase domain protein n=1 Tax=Candidatus Magnetoglobus multicellularis str. Araruama TaxID=890399 RepID=A0A1V1P1V3_9BACT|nr:MAG: nucleotidyltransferase domain protein [Candidatus Magnetoglobus multicellularis str. Araruama]
MLLVHLTPVHCISSSTNVYKIWGKKLIKMLNKNQINIFVDIISKKFKSKKIFLFGSNAYGKPQAESDIDICIVMYIGNKRKIELTREIRKEIYTFLNAPIDILIYDIDEFNERSLQPTTLENKILNHGVLLYG